MQSKADDIKERAKYLRDMLAEYADDETVWLDNEDGTPMGVIVKKTKTEEIRGRKRIRQSKKKE